LLVVLAEIILNLNGEGNLVFAFWRKKIVSAVALKTKFSSVECRVMGITGKGTTANAVATSLAVPFSSFAYTRK
jgi:hypothetical protein